MTTRARLGKVLIGAAVMVPALAVAALIVESHSALVHLERRQWMQWLVADAVVLALGMILNRGDGL